MLWIRLVRVANHAEHTVFLRHAVNGELGVENLVAAVLAIGLREHHQFDIGRVAPQRGEGVDEIVNFIRRQCQSPFDIGFFQRRFAAAQHIDVRHWCGMQFGEQSVRIGAIQHHAFGHAVVQMRGDLFQLRGRERGFAEKRA